MNRVEIIHEAGLSYIKIRWDGERNGLYKPSEARQMIQLFDIPFTGAIREKSKEAQR